MQITSQRRKCVIAGASVQLRRTDEGVLEVAADSPLDLARGLGFAHGLDRQTQMMLVRLAGQARLCECLHDSDDTLAIDIFMRQLNFAQIARDEVQRCSPDALAYGVAYAEGVNHALQTLPRPWEFRLAGYHPEPWTIADTLLTFLLMSYVGLAQTQQDFEKLLIQAIQSGVDVARLKQLFAPHLDGLTDEIVALVKQTGLFSPIVPALSAVLPAVHSSNSWAVAPQRSATGCALQCNDPHLDCNRLPAVWYETVLRTPDDYHLGVTMPGIPGVAMGRTRRVSAGFTYGFMDQVDYFIEEVRGGGFRRDDGLRPLRVRRETIWRKKHPAVEIAVYGTDAGTLEADVRDAALPDGLYLCRALAVESGGTARSLHVLSQMPYAQSVPEAQRLVRQVSISGNWVLADREGNIGFQQSGLLPVRKHSGLFPVPGWNPEFAWQGTAPADQLASRLNPPEGYIASANDDHNLPAGTNSVNLCQGSYRAGRIAELLTAKERLTLDDMRHVQQDLLSPQARRFMDVLRPMIDDTQTGRLLAQWDLRYDAGSRGATLFEKFYRDVLRRVFGEPLFGHAAWDALVDSTNLLGIYFQRFDEALLDDRSGWFAGDGPARDALFKSALAESLAVPADEVRPWGQTRQYDMHNLFFGGKLPMWLGRALGIDRGPQALPGGRATLVQGQLFRSHGRVNTFAPSWRFVTDLGRDQASTALVGGASDRIFSRWYVSDLARFHAGEYKTLHGIPDANAPVS